jgi:hypothetical protein
MLRITARSVADCHHRVAECREKGRRYEQPEDREFFAVFLASSYEFTDRLNSMSNELDWRPKKPC